MSDQQPDRRGSGGSRNQGEPGHPRRPYYRENRERILANRRAWEAANPEKRKQYRDKYRAAHRDRISEMERERQQRRREQAEKRERDRVRAREYQRRYIETHPDEHRAASRAYIARRLAQDPEGFRQHRRETERDWYRRNRDAVAARARDAYREDSSLARARAQRYYDRHADDIKQRNRDRYAANAEQRRTYQREYRRREKARREAGLPPHRLHRVKPSERDGNLAAATAFFTTPPDAERRKRLREERGETPTPPELIAAHEQDNARARAAAGFHATRDEILARRDEAQQRIEKAADIRAHAREQQRLAEQAEADRMDAIARVINTRLRPPPPARHPHHNDPLPVFPPAGPSAAGPAL